MFLLRKESEDEPIPNLLNPIVQSYDSSAAGNGKQQQTNSVSAINKEGLSDFGLKFVLKESVSSPNTLCTTPDSYATLIMVSGRMGARNSDTYPKPGYSKSGYPKLGYPKPG